MRVLLPLRAGPPEPFDDDRGDTMTLEHGRATSHPGDRGDGDATNPRVQHGPASVRPRLLLVGLLVDAPDQDAASDVVVVVDQAAQRARVEQRPLVVALARQRPPWSTNALLHVLVADRLDAELDAQRRTVHEVCELAGWSARVLLVTEPFAWTRRGRQRRWRQRLATLARLLGAELHPPAPPAHREDQRPAERFPPPDYTAHT